MSAICEICWAVVYIVSNKTVHAHTLNSAQDLEHLMLVVCTKINNKKTHRKTRNNQMLITHGFWKCILGRGKCDKSDWVPSEKCQNNEFSLPKFQSFVSSCIKCPNFLPLALNTVTVLLKECKQRLVARKFISKFSKPSSAFKHMRSTTYDFHMSFLETRSLCQSLERLVACVKCSYWIL